MMKPIPLVEAVIAVLAGMTHTMGARHFSSDAALVTVQ